MDAKPVFRVFVFFALTNPRIGCAFVLPCEALPKRRAHAFTTGTGWLPCLDSFQARPTWEMEYTVDRVRDGVE